jgi:NADH:ubiquinone oxidoreductase subunit 2 (subunit N)
MLNIEHIKEGTNILYFNQLYSIILYNKEVSFHFIFILFIMGALPPFTSFFSKLFIFIVTIEAKLEFVLFCILTISLISTFYWASVSI